MRRKHLVLVCLVVLAIAMASGCNTGARSDEGLYTFCNDGSVRGPYRIQSILDHGQQYKLTFIEPTKLQNGWRYVETERKAIPEFFGAVGLVLKGRYYVLPNKAFDSARHAFVLAEGTEIAKGAGGKEAFKSFSPHLTSLMSQGVPLNGAAVHARTLQEAAALLENRNEWGMVLKGVNPETLYPRVLGLRIETLKDWQWKIVLADGTIVYRFQALSGEDNDTTLQAEPAARYPLPFRQGFVYMMYDERGYKEIAKP